MGIKDGGFEFGCVGCCLPVGSAMSRKVLLVRWPADFSITKLRSVGNLAHAPMLSDGEIGQPLPGEGYRPEILWAGMKREERKTNHPKEVP